MSRLKSALQVVGALTLIVAGLRAFAFTTWTIPDDDAWLAASIAPTLWPGDTVVVLTVGKPDRGDLVRCPDPDHPGEWVVGRVTAVGNESVSLKGRTLEVDRATYNSTEACTEPYFTVRHPDSGNEVDVQCARVEMGTGWHFRGTGKKYEQRHDKDALVGPGRVFLLSDNRDLHEDSRDFGTLYEEDCMQRVVFRLWGGDGWSDAAKRMTVIR